MLHSILLVAAGFFYVNPTRMGNDDETIIQSYTYVEKRIANKVSVEKQMAQNEKLAEQGLQKIVEKKSNSKQEAQKSEQQLAAQKAKVQGENAETLVGLLHKAIAEHQHYPLAAEEMGRSGRVTVKFALSAQGEVSELHIAQSSGTTSLDEAALDAVRNAAPFTMAKSYLSQTQEFSVDVLFEIT